MREPTHSDVPYGDHERDRVDLYRADTQTPAPVFVFIHGGGFRGGDKHNLPAPLLEGCLSAGISVAAINYPLSDTLPYPAAFEHSRRAIQFVRSRAAAWNLDTSRVAAGGGSAGAGISMWIGFRADEADPDSADPVARESTRLSCIACWQGQCTYDLNEIRKIVTGPAYLHPALLAFFQVTQDDLDDPAAQAKFAGASAINFASAAAPPVHLWFQTPDLPMEPPPEAGPGIHHPNFGRHLKRRLDELGVECVVRRREDLGAGPDDDVAATFHGESVAFVKRHFGIP